MSVCVCVCVCCVSVRFLTEVVVVLESVASTPAATFGLTGTLKPVVSSVGIALSNIILVSDLSSPLFVLGLEGGHFVWVVVLVFWVIVVSKSSKRMVNDLSFFRV